MKRALTSCNNHKGLISKMGKFIKIQSKKRLQPVYLKRIRKQLDKLKSIMMRYSRLSASWTSYNSNMCFFVSVVTCPPLRTPQNGMLTGCQGDQPQRFGTVCHIACNQGYQQSGSSSRRCMENGLWSGLNTLCTGNRRRVESPK